jgi:hypothetical protein
VEHTIKGDTRNSKTSNYSPETPRHLEVDQATGSQSDIELPVAVGPQLKLHVPFFNAWLNQEAPRGDKSAPKWSKIVIRLTRGTLHKYEATIGYQVGPRNSSKRLETNYRTGSSNKSSKPPFLASLAAVSAVASYS